MLSKKDQIILAQAQTSLDQMWASVEMLMPFVNTLSDNGIPADLSEEYRQVAHLCCQIVGWELTSRVLSRDQYLRCEIIDDEGEETVISVKSTNGKVEFVVPSREVRRNVKGHTIPVRAHRVLGDNWSCFTEKGQALIVPESEIICEG